MSHFKYEINERNLRMQLKENAVPFNEDAWYKFESFSASLKNNKHENVMQRFHVSFNRNVILPVVFGAVIILFSLLLFNFVNIKNPHKETSETKQPELVKVPVVTEKKIVTPPIQKPVVAVVIKDTALDETPAAPITVKPEESRPQVAVETHKVSEPVATPKTESHSVEKDRIEHQTVKTEQPKKKRAKRQMVVTEASAEEDGQAPPPEPETAGN